MDYNNVGGGNAYEEQIEVWIGAGRDQMYILRSLIDSGFSQEHDIGVTLKLVGAAILPQAIMAGIGPDVALDAVRTLRWIWRCAVRCIRSRGLPDMTG